MSRTHSSLSGVLLALGLLIGLVLASCRDQPIDSGTIRIDTTVVTQYDTIVVNNRDTVIQTRVDTIIANNRDTIVRRDTILDTLEIIRTRVDTIEVPVNVTLPRRATLRFRVRSDSGSGGGNGAVEIVELNVTDWLQYQVVDSNNTVRGIGLSMSLGLPAIYSSRAIGLNQTTLDELRYSFQGLSLFVPIFRIGANNIPEDEILLNQHPYSGIPSGSNRGGMLVTMRRRGTGELEHFWTGKELEVDTPTGVEKFESGGGIAVKSIDRQSRMILLRIEASFYVPVRIGGRESGGEFDLSLDLELGY